MRSISLIFVSLTILTSCSKLYLSYSSSSADIFLNEKNGKFTLIVGYGSSWASSVAGGGYRYFSYGNYTADSNQVIFYNQFPKATTSEQIFGIQYENDPSRPPNKVKFIINDKISCASVGYDLYLRVDSSLARIYSHHRNWDTLDLTAFPTALHLTLIDSTLQRSIRLETGYNTITLNYQIPRFDYLSTYHFYDSIVMVRGPSNQWVLKSIDGVSISSYKNQVKYPLKEPFLKLDTLFIESDLNPGKSNCFIQ